MKTTVEINASLLKRAVRLSKPLDPTAVTEEALRLLIIRRHQVKFKDLFGKVPLDVEPDESRDG